MLKKILEQIGMYKRWSIDIGSSNTRIMCNGKLLLNEPSMVDFRNERFDRSFYKAISKTKIKGEIRILNACTRPFSDCMLFDRGMVVAARAMLLSFLREKLKLNTKLQSALFSVPASYTRMEDNEQLLLMFMDATSVISRKTHCVPSAVAAVAGLGLDIFDGIPTCVIDIGYGLTEMTIILNGKIVASKYSAIAGGYFSDLIMDFTRKDHNFATSWEVSEKIKLDFSNEKSIESGTDVYEKNKPSKEAKTVPIQYSQVKPCFEKYFERIIVPISYFIESAPQLMKKIYANNRLFLIGGGSMLVGLKEYLEKSLQVAMNTVSEPELVIVRGLDALSKNQIIEKVELKTK